MSLVASIHPSNKHFVELRGHMVQLSLGECQELYDLCTSVLELLMLTARSTNIVHWLLGSSVKNILFLLVYGYNSVFVF